MLVPFGNAFCSALICGASAHVLKGTNCSNILFSGCVRRVLILKSTSETAHLLLQANVQGWKAVFNGTLNVRAQPSLDADIVGTIKTGDVVFSQKEEGGFINLSSKMHSAQFGAYLLIPLFA